VLWKDDSHSCFHFLPMALSENPIRSHGLITRFCYSISLVWFIDPEYFVSLGFSWLRIGSSGGFLCRSEWQRRLRHEVSSPA
jgi:hypothetical protein